MRYFIAFSLLAIVFLSCKVKKNLYEIDPQTAKAKILSCTTSDSIHWQDIQLFDVTTNIDDFFQEVQEDGNIVANGEWSIKPDKRDKIKSISDLDTSIVNMMKRDVATTGSCVGFVYCWDKEGKDSPALSEFLYYGNLYYRTLIKYE